MSVLDQDAMFADVLQRLRTIAQSDRSFEAAQMQLINLPEIIRNAGPDWPRLKDKIRAGSMGFLKGCLEEADLVIPAGDGFLVIFADCDADASRRRAEELRLLLLEFYLGEEATRRLGIKVEHRRVKSDELGALMATPARSSTESSTDSCIFAPIWSPKAQLVGSYFCFPVHREAEAPRYGYDRGFAETGANTHHDYCALDLSLLDVVEKALHRYKPDETRPVLGVSVHSTTLKHFSARSEYLFRLGKIAPDLTRHLVVKIAEIEPGAPLINLSDWAGILRARVRQVWMEFHHTDTPPDLREVGVTGAGYRLPPEAARDGAGIVPYARHLRKWGESLAQQKQRLFIDNVQRADLVRIAEHVGASMITSDKFWPFQKWPTGVYAAQAPQITPFPAGQKALSSAPL